MEYQIGRHIKSVFGRRDVVYFDVGANVGYTVASVIAEHPRAAIRAFEPIKASFDELTARV